MNDKADLQRAERALILEAAVSLLDEDAQASVTAHLVAVRAGIEEATIQQHFPGAGELQRAAKDLRNAQEEQAAQMFRAAAAPDDRAASSYDTAAELERLRSWMASHQVPDAPPSAPDQSPPDQPGGIGNIPPSPDPAASNPPIGERPGPSTGREASDPPDDVGYRGPTACAAAGITYRQLDYWTRTGLIQASVRPAHGSGQQRLYSFRDILELKVVKRLLDTGVPLQHIRTAITHLRDCGVHNLAQITLMSDGVSVYECTSPDEIVDLVQRGQGIFGIALGQVWQEIEGTLADLPAERAATDTATEFPTELTRRRTARRGSI